MSILIAVLCVLLGSPSGNVRAAATSALSLIASPRDLSPLLDSRDPEVRMRASLILDDLAGAALRRELLSFATLPYIDADPCWTAKGLQPFLTAAREWHVARGLPIGPDAGWPEYSLATRLAMEAGVLWPDVTWGVLTVRTECYRAFRRWE